MKSRHFCFVAIDFHGAQAGGGIASYVDTLGRGLRQLGHEVTVIAKGRKREWARLDGLRVLFWPLGNLHWYWHRAHLPGQWIVLPLREIEWSMGIGNALRTLDRQIPVDLVEGSEIASLRARRIRAPLVMRLHGDPYVFAKYSGQRLDLGLRLSRSLERVALRRAAAVTSPSRYQALELAGDLAWGADGIDVIPNPVASWILAEAVRLPSRPALDVEQSRPIVLYSGRIEHRKGTIPFLESLPKVLESYPDAEYVIAGGRHPSINDHTLNRVLDEPKIRSHVRLLGHLPWKELAAWYRKATVFVMPSYYETFGISCLEAMAFRLPVVATTAGGLPEVVEDEVVGLLVPPGEPAAMAVAIMRLLRDPDLRERMGQAGRERVLSEFTPERVVDQTLRLYERVLAD